MATKTPPKRDVMLALLQQADSVYVNFDPRREGVLVPPQLKRNPRVVLQYGMNMAIPIPDLDVGEEGIGATLSFDRTPSWTFVPWAAVFAIVSQDQRGMLWEADVPREVEVEAKKPTAAPTAPVAVPSAGPADKRAPEPKAGKGSKGKTKRAALRAVEGGQGKPAPAPSPIAEARPAAAPKATLKLERETPVPAGHRPTEPTGGATKPTDEIVEPPRREAKKKRELPPYLRVVK